ncbi:uncharacterized protein [Nicotiana tomentosiformis]|uniref:uncharacterized protein n=1 Tax=Nicotiana tomentosiformis TaxID=4098 RepID=UPI00388C9757
MAPYEALHGRLCHSPVGWFEPGKARLLGIDLVCDALEMVKLTQEQLCLVQSRQKIYADRKDREVAYMVGEKVLLRVSPMKGVMSMVQLDEDLTYDVEPVAILDLQVQKLKSTNIASVKVHWRGQPAREATWKTEHKMQKRYPYLFETLHMILDSFEDERLFKRRRM